MSRLSKQHKLSNLEACCRHDYFCAALTGLCSGVWPVSSVGTTGTANAALWTSANISEFASEIADSAVEAERERKEGEHG